MLLNGIAVDLPKTLKYDYTYKPPGYDALYSASNRQPIDDVLSPGEKVIWRGQPPQGLLLFRAQDLAMVPFFAIWTGFSLFWEAMAIMAFLEGGMGSPGICFPLFGLPFVAIGLYMLSGRFLLDAPARRRTYYALTDRRVVIVSGLRDRSVVSIPLDRIDNVQMILHRNGKGTLMFHGQTGTMEARGRYYVFGMSQSSGVPSFDHIPEPRAVYDMILEAQDNLKVYRRGYTPKRPE